MLKYQMRSKLFDYDTIKQMPNFGCKHFPVGIYRGQLNELGQRHGKGIQVYSDSIRVYEGDWVHDKREGQGYEVYSNLNLYEGQFRNNKPNGKGKYRWKNGDFYEGSWFEGLRQGVGYWKSRKGETYEGEWSKGEACGFGLMKWANGD
jgi:hypothetical protein